MCAVFRRWLSCTIHNTCACLHARAFSNTTVDGGAWIVKFRTWNGYWSQQPHSALGVDSLACVDRLSYEHVDEHDNDVCQQICSSVSVRVFSCSHVFMYAVYVCACNNATRLSRENGICWTYTIECNVFYSLREAFICLRASYFIWKSLHATWCRDAAASY